jgi:phenylacetate-CoA ligase
LARSTDTAIRTEQTEAAAFSRYLEPELETMPRAELERLQEQRILELVPRAYERSSFYRAHWDAAGANPAQVRSMADFAARIPFMSKDDIRAFRERTGDPFGGMLLVPPEELCSLTTSSGTTGDPEFFPEIWDQFMPLPTDWARSLWELGVRPGDRVLGLPGTFRGQIYHAYQVIGAVPLFLDTWIGRWKEVLPAIEHHRPTTVLAVFPNIMELDNLSQHHDLRRAFSSLKGLIFSGQPLGRMRRKIEEEWGVKVFMFTSAGDCGTAWECQEHDGYHLWEDYALFECLRPDGTPADDGEVGELVSTNLDDPAAPIIRYRTGDLVRMTRARCGCGRTHARCWVLGRVGDETVVGDRQVVLTELWEAIEGVPACEQALFQIIRRSREVDELRLRVGYNPDRAPDLEALHAALIRAISDAVGLRPHLELVTEDELIARAPSVAKLARVVKE